MSTSFTVRMDKCDCDIGQDAMAAVFNTSTDPTQQVAICEVRIVPQAINDDVATTTGCQGIVALERITAASGGTELSPIKYDTGASTLPSQIKARRNPSSVTISGGTLRRFGDALSMPSIGVAGAWTATRRAPGIVDSNDHSGRTAESQDIWHADGDSNTEPIVLREGEGIALVRRDWGVPQAMHLGLVVKVVSTGNVYRWFDGDFGTVDELNMASLSLMNESGSGILLQVYIVTFPTMGESNIPRYRLVVTEAAFQGGFAGETVTLCKHDTAATITGVECYRGPMRLLAHARGEGAAVEYHDYQGVVAPIATQQAVNMLRAWGGSAPYVRTTSSPGLVQEVLSRGEPEVWPGDRRGVGGGLDLPIILRPGQGLAIIGGGNGAIETSEQAYINVEFAGYVSVAGEVWPAEADVELGVDYGPTGSEYTGELDVDEEVLATVFEGTVTVRQGLRALLAALAHKSSGGGTATLKFRDLADALDRIVATVDAAGNRTAVTLDLSGAASAGMVEGDLDLLETMRALLAAAANESSGGGTSTVKFRDRADTKDRITATVDANGNRTAVTLDVT